MDVIKILAYSGRDLINFISVEDLSTLDIANHWEILIDPLFRNKTITCTCGELSDSLMLNSYSAPSVLLV